MSENDTATPSADTPHSASALAALAAHLIDLLEQERARMARELHDELGSNLTAINLDLASVASQLQAGVPRTRIERSLRVLKETVELKRRLIQSLRPSMIDSLGLVPTLRMEAEAFTARSRIACHAALGEEPPLLEPARALALYRVAQCTLHRIAERATASHVDLTLAARPDAVELSIIDNGTHVPRDSGDMDMLTMEMQVQRFGGSLEITHQATGGTCTVAALPPGSAAHE